MALELSNGTLVEILPTGTRITLPTGEIVEGEPQGTTEQAQTALDLGYGNDTLAMCQDHDPLHSALCSWLGLPTSYSMLAAAGVLPDSQRQLANAEETAVMAVQRFMKLTGAKLRELKLTE